jgi:hypothetical protein
MVNPAQPGSPLARPSDPADAETLSPQSPARRPWRAPTLERLALEETRNTGPSPAPDAGGFGSISF